MSKHIIDNQSIEEDFFENLKLFSETKNCIIRIGHYHQGNIVNPTPTELRVLWAYINAINLTSPNNYKATFELAGINDSELDKLTASLLQLRFCVYDITKLHKLILFGYIDIDGSCITLKHTNDDIIHECLIFLQDNWSWNDEK